MLLIGNSRGIGYYHNMLIEQATSLTALYLLYASILRFFANANSGLNKFFFDRAIQKVTRANPTKLITAVIY